MFLFSLGFEKATLDLCFGGCDCYQTTSDVTAYDVTGLCHGTKLDGLLEAGCSDTRMKSVYPRTWLGSILL